MLQTIRGKYRAGRVELTEIPEQVAEADVLVTFLSDSEATAAMTMRASRPETLYGIWRDKVPADFDVEAALKEVRSQSQLAGA